MASVQDLVRRRDAAIKQLQHFRVTGQLTQARRLEAQVARLNAQIQSERKPVPMLRHRPKQVPHNRRGHHQSVDPLIGVPITAKNCLDMVRHYKKLLAGTFFLSAAHRVFAARLHEAQRVCRQVAKSARRGARGPSRGRDALRAQRYDPDKLQQQIDSQQEVLQSATRRGDRAGAMRAQALLERLSTMQDAHQIAVPDEDAIPVRTSSDLPDASTDASAEVAADPGADLGDVPWYKKPLVWLGIAAAGGVALAMSGKGAKARGPASGMRATKITFGGAPRRRKARYTGPASAIK